MADMDSLHEMGTPSGSVSLHIDTPAFRCHNPQGMKSKGEFMTRLVGNATEDTTDPALR